MICFGLLVDDAELAISLHNTNVNYEDVIQYGHTNNNDDEELDIFNLTSKDSSK